MPILNEDDSSFQGNELQNVRLQSLPEDPAISKGEAQIFWRSDEHKVRVDNGATGAGQTGMRYLAYEDPAYLDWLPLAAVPAWKEGRVFYDPTKHTLCVYNDVSNTTLNVGAETWVRVLNRTGSTILDGKPVYVNGATGQMPTIALASSAVHPSDTIGLVTADILDQAEGWVTLVGEVNNLDTSALTEGAPVFLTTTPGGLTSTHPTSGLVTQVAICLYSHNNHGKLLVRVGDHSHYILANNGGTAQMIAAPLRINTDGSGTDLALFVGATGASNGFQVSTATSTAYMSIADGPNNVFYAEPQRMYHYTASAMMLDSNSGTLSIGGKAVAQSLQNGAGLTSNIKRFQGIEYDSTNAYGGYTTNLTYDPSTRKIKLSHKGGDSMYFRYWVNKGTAYETNGNLCQLAHAATPATYFFYFKTNGSLDVSTTPWNILGGESPVAIVSWTDSSNYVCWDERHHHERNIEWHNSQHWAIGTYAKDGPPVISGYTLNSSTEAHRQYTTAAFTVVDEDINVSQAQITAGATRDILYKGTGYSYTKIQNALGFAYNGSTSYIQRQVDSSGSGLTDVGTTKCVNYYMLIATTFAGITPIFTVPGYQEFSSQSDAVAIDPINDCPVFVNLQQQEIDIVAKLTYGVSNGYSNNGKCRLLAVSYIQSSRQSTIAGGGTSTISGSGTTNKVAKWSSTSSLTDSTITDDGTNVSLTGGLTVGTTGSFGAVLATQATFGSTGSFGTLVSGNASISSANYPPLDATRTTSSTSGTLGAMRLTHRTSGDNSTGGPAVVFAMADDTATTPVDMGYMGIRRNGADNSGTLVLAPYSSGAATETLITTTAQMELRAATTKIGTSATDALTITGSTSGSTGVFHTMALSRLFVSGDTGSSAIDMQVNVQGTTGFQGGFNFVANGVAGITGSFGPVVRFQRKNAGGAAVQLGRYGVLGDSSGGVHTWINHADATVMQLTSGGALTVDGFVYTRRANTTDNVYYGSTTGATGFYWAMRADGRLQIGPGDGNYDVNLYRSAADNLKTDDTLNVGSALNVSGISTLSNYAVVSRAAAANAALFAQQTGDAVARWNVACDGTTQWGDGTNARDTAINRTAAGELTVTNDVKLRTLTASGTVSGVTGTFTGGVRANLAAIGAAPSIGSDVAQFSHKTYSNSAGGYGYIQDGANGSVYVSAPTGQTVNLRVNNSTNDVTWDGTTLNVVGDMAVTGTITEPVDIVSTSFPFTSTRDAGSYSGVVPYGAMGIYAKTTASSVSSGWGPAIYGGGVLNGAQKYFGRMWFRQYGTTQGGFELQTNSDSSNESNYTNGLVIVPGYAKLYTQLDLAPDGANAVVQLKEYTGNTNNHFALYAGGVTAGNTNYALYVQNDGTYSILNGGTGVNLRVAGNDILTVDADSIDMTKPMQSTSYYESVRDTGSALVGRVTGDTSDRIQVRVNGDIYLTNGDGTNARTVSNAELGYLDGVTSAIQTQLNAKDKLPTVATSSTSTGTINWDLSNSWLHLTTKLTGNITLNMSTTPSAGQVNKVMLQQGTTLYSVTLTFSGVTFYIAPSTSTGASPHTIAAAAWTLASQFTSLTLNWISATSCFVDIDKV